MAARLFVAVGLVVVGVVWGSWAVLVFAAVDAGATLWTAEALRRDAIHSGTRPARAAEPAT